MKRLSLLDLPRDAILNILYILDVEDLLAVEQTSRGLREVVQARHLWLVHLCQLDQARAPDVHPSTDISQLPTRDIRSLAVNAARSYSSCNHVFAEDAPPTCSYKLSQTVLPFGETRTVPRPHGHRTPPLHEIENAKLCAGGRYLFIIDTTNLPDRFSWVKTFRVLDLQRSNKCVWSYSPCDELQPEDPSFVDFDDFTYDIAPDGSILLILRVYDLWVGQREVRSACKVLHLIPDPEDDTFRCNMIYYSRGQGIHHDFGMSITNKYAVIIDFEKLKIVTWDPEIDAHGTLMVTKARSCTLSLERGHYQELRVVHDHLIFADDAGNLCALSLPEALSLAQKRGLDSVVDIEDISISRLSITGNEAIVKYAVYQPPTTSLSSRLSSPVFFSVLTFTEREDDLRLICTCVQATFDPILSGAYKWRLTRTSIPQEVPFNFLTSYSNMTAHGRVLVVTGEANVRKASLGVITRDGEAVPVELSENVRWIFKGNANFEYPFIEEYSGTIVVARLDDERRARVDIFVVE